MGHLAESLRSFVLGPFSSGDPALARLFGGTPPAAGVPVTEYTALNFSAVWQAVTIIAGSIASLPLILYKRRQDGGKERFVDHPTYRLLHDEPNPEMSSMVFRETVLAHALSWGNGYAEIERDQAGRPVALWPITPDRATPYREADGRLRYRVVNQPGTSQTLLDPADMFHMPGLGFDGVCGYSVVRRARETVSLGLAAEGYGAKFFGNGAFFGLGLEHPGKLSLDAQKRLKDTWIEHHGSLFNAHGVAVFEEGMKANKLTIPPDDAQFLETRKFQVTEIARWFNLPPHKLRDLERATFSNIEHQSIDFVTDTLRPWFVRFEQECNRKLIRPLERRIQFVEHLVDGLLRGDIASRYAAYAVGRNWGWLSANDVLEKENMNPLPGDQGKIYLVPLSMAPADDLPSLKDRVESLGALVRAGYDPVASLKALALPVIKHSGAPPVTVQPRDDYPGASPRGGGQPGQPAADAGGGDPKPESEPDPKDRAAQRARLITAQRAVFIEGVGRMVRREASAARRASRKPATFRAWIDDFYARHAPVFVATILPAVQVHLSQIGSDQDPLVAARALVTDALARSCAALAKLHDAKPADLATSVDALVSRWEIETPPLLADTLMTEELTHAIA